MAVKRGVKVAGNEVRIIIREKRKKGGLRIICRYYFSFFPNYYSYLISRHFHTPFDSH